MCVATFLCNRGTHRVRRCLTCGNIITTCDSSNIITTCESSITTCDSIINITTCGNIITTCTNRG